MRKKIKLLSFSLFFILISLCSTLNARAYVAWPDTGNAFLDTALKEINIQIQAAAIGALKSAAIATINDTVNNMISGTEQAGALFIQDWEDYLFKSPRNSARAHMNDFFTITSRGKTSGNFKSACGESYTKWRTAGAKESVGLELDLTSLQSDIEELACDGADALGGIGDGVSGSGENAVEKMFDKETWDVFVAFMQPNNNPIAYQLIAESEYQKTLSEAMKESETKAKSYSGYIGQEENGVTITPGSLLSDITSSANTIDNLVMANAESVGEMTGIVVGKIAGSVIKQGIGNARKNVQSKINKKICDTSQSLRDELKGLSPNGDFPGFGIGSLGETADTECVIR